MTLRMVAGESEPPSLREMVREPTGSPVSTKASTTWRKISRERSFSATTLWPSGESIAGPILKAGSLQEDGRYVRWSQWGVNAP